MEKVQALIINVWIEKCGVPWGSSIVLVAKPYQEHIQNIDDFIWRICVSYRKLKPLDFPIPCCDGYVNTVGAG